MQHMINEDLMFDRHRRLRVRPDVVCEFTTDVDLLHQYYVMRSIHLSKVLPTPVPAEADSYDERADIMVVRSGRQVVGGARILARRTPQDPPLYIERGGFLLNEVLPVLELEKHPYCELSKLFLIEEFQNTAVVHQMYQCILQHCTKIGMDYGFATSSPQAARIHKRSLSGTNTKVKTLSHIKVPTEGPERADNTSYQVLTVFTMLNMKNDSVEPTSQQHPLEELAE